MKECTNIYDLIVIGAGPSGMMAAIVAAKKDKRVLLLEKLPSIATKLKATGGGKCNVTNRLDDTQFMSHFGRNGRFMQDALKNFNSDKLEIFLNNIGVQTHSPDGFRVFPISHNSQTIIEAFKKELDRTQVRVQCSTKVEKVSLNDTLFDVVASQSLYKSRYLIIATGGLGFPSLGAEGDGHNIALSLGHHITQLYPAMMPLKTKETWGDSCRAETIAKVEIRINLKKYKKLSAKGDLIFTKNGIRGPVVLDFAREITPLLEKYNEVPILLNFTKGMNEEKIIQYFKEKSQQFSSMKDLVSSLVPKSLAEQLCLLSGINPQERYKHIDGSSKDKLIRLLSWTPLHVVGHQGFELAMITRGGIKLKEIDPKTMQSKLVKNLYFCGEIIDIDGPCGGYNLQWSFSSGFLAGECSAVCI